MTIKTTIIKKKIFLSNHIIMVKLTKYELGLIAKNRGINNYLNMSREKFLRTLDKLERITENLSECRLNKITKMQNLSLNEFEKIEEMINFSENKLKEITKTRHIKNYKDMSKEDLLIAFLKSNQNRTELLKSEDDNAEIRETKKVFNELRDNFSKEEINKIREKFYFRGIDEYLKELEQKDSLTKQEKQKKKRYTKKLQKAKEFLKNLKEDLNRLEKYQYNDNEDYDYEEIREIENSFNKINEEDYYKPIKTKDSDDKYTEHESRGDKDKNLSLKDYLDIIRPYLKDMIRLKMKME